MEIKTLNLLISPNGVFQIIQDISWAKVIETYEHSVLIIHTPSSGPGGGPKLKKQTNNWRETPLGRCDYLVMSYGLTSAPAFFKHSFNDVLRDMLEHLWLCLLGWHPHPLSNISGWYQKSYDRKFEVPVVIKCISDPFISDEKVSQSSDPWTCDLTNHIQSHLRFIVYLI